MKKQKLRRNTLEGRVFYPLAAGALGLSALLAASAAAAVWPAASKTAGPGWLLAGAAALFALAGGGSVALVRLVCRRYLAPIARATGIVALAAAGDHSAPLSGIPRTSEEAVALLDAAGELGTRESGCLLEMEGVLRRIADGDLTARLPCGKALECGGACGALDGMSEQLRGAVGSVRSALGQLSGQLEELERDAGRLARSGLDRRQDREALARALERLARRLEDRAGSVRALNGDAQSFLRELEGHGERLEELSQAVDRIGDCAGETGKIVKSMESTAFQCSVLARTAYVEAAGAGVNGKGFAIVASELRVLASRSAQAAQDAAALMGEMDRTVREGSALAAGASRELQGVAGRGQELCRRAARETAEPGETRDARDAARQAARLSAAGAEDQLLAARAAAAVRLLRERAGRMREALRVFRVN